LIGAGPGDSKLITIKGMELLKMCQVLVYDRLVSEELLEKAPKDCEKINVGKSVGNHAITQEEINAILIEKAGEGKMIVRLKGGDPFVFGRGGEEILALSEEEIPYQVIPGVTACIAVPECAGIPVTHRGMSQSFHVITGHTASEEETDNYEALAKLSGTLVFLMGVGNLSKITTALMEQGKPAETPVAVIANGTLPNETILRATLGTIQNAVKANQIKPPAVVVIGAVADLDFLCEKSKTRTKVGVVGTQYMYEQVEDILQRSEMEVQDFSFSKVVPCNRKGLEAELHSNLKRAWIVFTSANGVRIFFETVKKNGMDYRIFSDSKFAVIGNGTRNILREYGFLADFMPDKFYAGDLARGLLEVVRKNERIIIPRAMKGSKELTDLLEAGERTVVDLPIYSIEYDKERREASRNNVQDMDYITFASASGVQGLLHGDNRTPGEILGKAIPVCIGEATGKALRANGIWDFLMAGECTAEGLAQAILNQGGTQNDEANEKTSGE
ncbi:MAG: uroporphyrinogen-III C-methyltransferase, partial [Lachnospiraceae bacterium]